VPSTVAAAGSESAERAAVVSAYRSWLHAQASLLRSSTTTFVSAVRSGDLARAKQLYAPARIYWERIEPVAETNRDLARRLDGRAAELGNGDTWWGWHRLEKALWSTRSLAGTAPVADALLADTDELVARLATEPLVPDRVTESALEHLDSLATRALVGEEETYSHSDLWDAQGEIDGAKKAYDLVAIPVEVRDPLLAQRIEVGFALVQQELDRHRTATGFRPYTDLTPAQVRELAVSVASLSDALSRLTASVGT